MKLMVKHTMFFLTYVLLMRENLGKRMRLLKKILWVILCQWPQKVQEKTFSPLKIMVMVQSPMWVV